MVGGHTPKSNKKVRTRDRQVRPKESFQMSYLRAQSCGLRCNTSHAFGPTTMAFTSRKKKISLYFLQKNDKKVLQTIVLIKNEKVTCNPIC